MLNPLVQRTLNFKQCPRCQLAMTRYDAIIDILAQVCLGSENITIEPCNTKRRVRLAGRVMFLFE